MRHSNQTERGRRRPTGRLGFVVVAVAVVLAACGTPAAPPASATPAPTPVITPDPHLKEPVTADQVYGILAAAKVAMTCPNANLGNGNPRIAKQINCTVEGWPLRIIQYTSVSTLGASLKWKAGAAPAGNEAPYNWAALNVLVQYGPISARAPKAPEAGRQATASALVAILDPLLWPLEQHSVVDVPSRTPEPAATPAPTAKPSAKPTTKPGKTPRPSKAP
jgi:hypothetical protein